MVKLVNLRDPVPETKPDDPATIPKDQIAIYDHNGYMRGRVHAGATSATVARFTGAHGAELKKRDGKYEWRMPRKKGVTVAQQQTGALDKEAHAASVKAARGSAKAK